MLRFVICTHWFSSLRPNSFRSNSSLIPATRATIHLVTCKLCSGLARGSYSTGQSESFAGIPGCLQTSLSPSLCCLHPSHTPALHTIVFASPEAARAAETSTAVAWACLFASPHASPSVWSVLPTPPRSFWIFSVQAGHGSELPGWRVAVQFNTTLTMGSLVVKNAGSELRHGFRPGFATYQLWDPGLASLSLCLLLRTQRMTRPTPSGY